MLLNLLFDVRAKWYDIGLQLPGIKQGDVDAINADSGGKSEVCLRKLISCWIRNGEATREALAVVLESPVVGAKHLAQMLRYRARKTKSKNG